MAGSEREPPPVDVTLFMHIARFWPENQCEAFTWELGPLRPTVPEFRVLRITPLTAKDPWVYVTLGAWRVSPDGEPASEFLILSPCEDPANVGTLAMVTYFHADARYRLDVGRTVNIGRAWIDGASAAWLYVSRPYAYASEFETCEAGGVEVRYRWLVPITEAEARFVKERDGAAFEEAIEASGVNVVAAERPSVV